ncbi:hypothetical protein AB1M95_17015 [Sulfitobacter sp. LCG007]
MTAQLIVRYSDFDATAYETDSENRSNSGLTQLQAWREGPSSRWVLFEIRDRERAQAWLDKGAALGHAPDEHHFLETT